jgi:hypothetical protein
VKVLRGRIRKRSFRIHKTAPVSVLLARDRAMQCTKVRTLVQEASNNRDAASGDSVGDPRHFGADPDPDPFFSKFKDVKK